SRDCGATERAPMDGQGPPAPRGAAAATVSHLQDGTLRADPGHDFAVPGEVAETLGHAQGRSDSGRGAAQAGERGEAGEGGLRGQPDEPNDEECRAGAEAG